MIDDALAALDHVGARVTAFTASGMGCGAAFAIYRGFPIVRTSASAALSCALVSTACFGMERLAYGVISHSSMLMNEKSGPSNLDDSGTSFTAQSAANQQLIYGSNALGGILGGSIVGFLYQGRPMAGALLLTPLMLGMGKVECLMDEYKSARLQQLIGERGPGRKGT